MATMLVVLTAGPATAAGAGEDFGQHVRTCAQTMGFDGVHNPGMHQGFAGWDPSQPLPKAISKELTSSKPSVSAPSMSMRVLP